MVVDRIGKEHCKVNLQESDDEHEEDEESSAKESLLEKTFNERNSLNADNHNHRRCLPFRLVHVRNRQKIVILATLLVIVIMLACAVIIWIGMGKNPIDSTVVARACTMHISIHFVFFFPWYFNRMLSRFS
ncbi:uncharacterized protein LOC133792216 [Humulus lupulus]|uniref:uncharacterized protein LOC133792216 n=1 Tax=Humulus lupulus TaxID=3486 RepID=UPI002B40F976|nr:uncharacterized protein LOC133792216 [Humulus lupulus]